MYSFDETIPTELCEIMGRNKSDKGHIDIMSCKHNFTTFYHSIFNNIKNNNINIFELGLGTFYSDISSNMGPNGTPGASLYGWSEYFKNANIYGADIDKRILFNTDRIKTFYCDQTDKNSILSMWNLSELSNIKFEIILEDALHTFEANKCFFENSIHKLSKTGYYIIEDIRIYEFHYFEEQIKRWEEEYPELLFTLLKVPSTVNVKDNNLLVVKYKV
jgi:predicted transposase YbfD/YdcC